ncbi:hypothetical protein MSIMFB_04378 [Mycobacterium simulans]|uniref:ESX-1 secretion-associated protein n=1 Tax=Mycobacterium simulans TaxID=627089 RepID=A0A7Z7NCA3_9MYCO|nr:hypothetical protein [Mycobacterium simulans]SOJ56901.1 hypothetical protein MSIMFB_04378 [Mycobacterium simulans]
MESLPDTAELRVSEGRPCAEAGRCESLAGTLAGNIAPAGLESSWLGSAVTVNTAHAEIVAAGMRCTYRVQATAAKLAAAASRYAANDADSATRLRTLDGSKVC